MELAGGVGAATGVTVGNGADVAGLATGRAAAFATVTAGWDVPAFTVGLGPGVTGEPEPGVTGTAGAGATVGEPVVPTAEAVVAGGAVDDVIPVEPVAVEESAVGAVTGDAASIGSAVTADRIGVAATGAGVGEWIATDDGGGEASVSGPEVA